MTTIPPDPAVRRAQLLSLAVDYAVSADTEIDRVAREAERIGVDLTSPADMVALSVLADNVRFGMEPSKRALAILGCAA